MDYYSTRKPGDLSTAFNNVNQEKLPEKYQILKKGLLSNPSKIQESWDRLLKRFQEEKETIQKLGSDVIPQVHFSKILENNGKFPSSIVDEIKKRGCVVVKNVVEPELALKYKKDVKEYINMHRDKIVGFPGDDPQVWELYWSKSQIAARSHPNFDMATNALNALWHAEENTSIDLSTNVTYCDRLRIRQPGDASFTLDEHIDGGSVERWEDPEYRKCYSDILNGQWEKYDAYDATHRVDANMDMYNCNGGCSMFRTFQGWMSMSNVKPGGGTLRVCPIIKLTTAYLILRPLLPDLINTTDMGGAFPSIIQKILPDLHPEIIEAMVPMPEVNPGDCVFWHCDGVHAVEKFCGNPTDSSVMYIPSTPLCKKNVDYLMKQRRAFELGMSPPDFPLNNCELNLDERAKPEDLSKLGKIGMGFERFIINGSEFIANGSEKS